MKKILGIITAVVLLMTVWGCGKQPVATKQSAAPAATQAVAQTVKAPVGDARAVAATTEPAWEPTKKITWVVPFEAGGNSDVPARIVAKYMSKYSTQPVEITNIIGAGGRAGAEEVRKAAPDGYTILMQPVAYPMQYSLGIAKFTYEDFEPISLWANSTLAVVVNSSSGWKTMEDLVAAAKANPGKIKMGSKTGTLPLFAILDMQKRFGVEFNMVDLDNKAPELLSKRIDAYIDGFGAVKQYIDSGDFNCVGIISDVDVPGYESLVNYREMGQTGYEFLKQSFGLWAPKGTPAEAVEYINRLVKQMSADPDCVKEMANLGIAPAYLSVADYTQYMQDTYKAFKDIASQII